MYRAAEIVDVVETGKVYFVGKMRTNIGTKLKFGKEERVFRLEFISNQRISPQEFVKWKEVCLLFLNILPASNWFILEGSSFSSLVRDHP